MKTVKPSLFLICLVYLSVFSAYSQITVPASEIWLDKLRLNKLVNNTEMLSYSNILGDPYIYGDFRPGKIVFATGESYNVDMRFDMYANQIHIRYKDNIFGIGHPEKLSLMVIDTINFIYDKIIKPGSGQASDKSSYFIIKTDGKCKLLIRKNMRIQDAEPPKPYQEEKLAKFIPLNDTYYLKLDNSNAVLIRNKGDILTVLDDKRGAVSDFIKANKLGIKNVEDLVKIVSFYNKK